MYALVLGLIIVLAKMMKCSTQSITGWYLFVFVRTWTALGAARWGVNQTASNPCVCSDMNKMVVARNLTIMNECRSSCGGTVISDNSCFLPRFFVCPAIYNPMYWNVGKNSKRWWMGVCASFREAWSSPKMHVLHRALCLSTSLLSSFLLCKWIVFYTIEPMPLKKWKEGCGIESRMLAFYSRSSRGWSDQVSASPPEERGKSWILLLLTEGKAD